MKASRMPFKIKTRCSALGVLFVLALWMALVFPTIAGITLSPSSETTVCVGSTLSVSASTDCEFGGIAISPGSGATLLITGGDGKFTTSGTWGAPSAVGDVTINASDACGNSTNVTIHV